MNRAEVDRAEGRRRGPRPSSWMGKAGLVIALLPWIFHYLIQLRPPG